MICLPELPDLGLEIEMDETMILILGQTVCILISLTIGYFIGCIEGPNLCAKFRRIFKRQRQHPVRVASPEQRSITTGSPVLSRISPQPKQAETPRLPEAQEQAKPEVLSHETVAPVATTESQATSLPSTTLPDTTPAHSHRLAKVQAAAAAKALAHEAKERTAGPGPDASIETRETEKSVEKVASGTDQLVEVGQKSSKDEKPQEPVPYEKKVKVIKARKTKPRKSQLSVTDVSGDDVAPGPSTSEASENTQVPEDDRIRKEPKSSKARSRARKQKRADAVPKETPAETPPKELPAEKEAPQAEVKEPPEAKVEEKVTSEPVETKEPVSQQSAGRRTRKKGPGEAKITKSRESTEGPTAVGLPGKRLESRESLHGGQGKAGQVKSPTTRKKASLESKPSKESGLFQKPSKESGLFQKPSKESGLLHKPSTESGLIQKPSKESGLLSKPSKEGGLPPQKSMSKLAGNQGKVTKISIKTAKTGKLSKATKAGKV